MVHILSALRVLILKYLYGALVRNSTASVPCPREILSKLPFALAQAFSKSGPQIELSPPILAKSGFLPFYPAVTASSTTMTCGIPLT
jgi:hypothetical protein